ncbi:shikimate kinase [Raoultibacter phocaeensis]|uniref:shikimate kinase n=1 Tax=Raoultibacter phocaeensis TaxID=2479841 RepID=UPI0021047DC2|nr:shikimate kinase [Raoultibacter phocaeensis]
MGRDASQRPSASGHASGGDGAARRQHGHGSRGGGSSRQQHGRASGGHAPNARNPQAPKRNRPPHTLAKPVFFVGFMGAGKTSVSRRLARMCNISSIDLDTYLERREDRKVKDIFAEVGEDGFRDIETAVLREFMAAEPQLVSCGGGIVKRPENRELLKRSGFVVYLKVSADEAQSRISDLSTRPLFNDIEAARAMNAERLPLYEEVADVVIDTAGKSVGRIAGEVKDLLKKKGILWQSHE